MKNKIVCSIIILTASITLFAQKPITGAFGYELGKEFDQKQILSTVSNCIYQVKPLKLFRKFNVYMVIVVPSLNQIAGICASCYPTEAEVSSEMDICKTALEKIYGPARKIDIGFGWDHEGRSIKLASHRNQNGPVISLMYQDDRLCAKSEQEIKQKITSGAFGFKFGDRLDQSVIISEVDKNWFQVRPPKLSPIFQQYGCEVTPKTKRIFSVIGIREMKNRSDIDTIAAQVQMFFGDPKSKETENGKVTYKWEKGQVIILLYNSDNKIWIWFTDAKLEKMVKIEQKTLELEKTDSSAL